MRRWNFLYLISFFGSKSNHIRVHANMLAHKKPKNVPDHAAPALPPTTLVDVIGLIADTEHAHFDGALPRLVALGCKDLAELVFAGRLRLRGVLVRSPSTHDPDGKELAAIREGYERFRRWYPRLYTVVGVSATAPKKVARRGAFYTFYDEVLISHSVTIKTLHLDILDFCSVPPEPSSPLVRGFLDSARLCTETTTLSIRLRHIGTRQTARMTEAVIEYMYNLEHLSFSGFDYDPFLVHMTDPANRKHILYLLPSTLVSLRLAGRVSFAMARNNESAIQYLLERDRLPSLVSVDLSCYRVPMTPPRDAPGLMMRLAHPNSRVSRVLLPADAESTYFATLCLRKLLDQGHFLAARRARKPFTVVVSDTDARVAAARMASIRRTVQDYELENVLVEWLGVQREA